MNVEKFEKILRTKKIKYDFYTIKNINNKKKIAFFYLKKKIIFLLKISLNIFTSNQSAREWNRIGAWFYILCLYANEGMIKKKV